MILSGRPVKIQVVVIAESHCVCSPNCIFGVFVVPFAEFDVRLPRVASPLTRVDVRLSARLCTLGFPSTRLTDGFLGGREMLMADRARAFPPSLRRSLLPEGLCSWRPHLPLVSLRCRHPAPGRASGSGWSPSEPLVRSSRGPFPGGTVPDLNLTALVVGLPQHAWCSFLGCVRVRRAALVSFLNKCVFQRPHGRAGARTARALLRRA